ncbi:glutamine amidotransferase [Herbaspirillum rubrisubalbicans]|uniref:glutamine amidotransferase n=1 Tax=Herbaspirillum rubrisubalbicans TaxID=80842 RepID=UPI0015590F56|nr:glutamine amidotransferase [Herbaspirillum rubrisubalbicans]NQE50838.1 glutamine amidotransferase [Herbaspirillum rubrisubalbicans]
MKTALALRHVPNEDLGQLAPLLLGNGYQIRYVEVGVDALVDVSPLDADLVIVLGGPVAVYDSEAYPWLRAEVAWLRARMLEDLPTLGICLGAQLMAAALHARVYPGSCGKEIGWASLQPGQHLDDSPWLREVVEQQTPVLHWHGDTFDLPAGARHLAASARYPHQAFAWGRHCLALQFHPEVDVRTVEHWLVSHAHEIAHTRDISVARLRADAKRHRPQFEAAMRRFWQGWLDSLPGAQQGITQRRRRA